MAKTALPGLVYDNLLADRRSGRCHKLKTKVVNVPVNIQTGTILIHEVKTASA